MSSELTVLVEVEDRELSGPRINEQIGRSNCLLIVYMYTSFTERCETVDRVF